jgi:hypothetical protein
MVKDVTELLPATFGRAGISAERAWLPGAADHRPLLCNGRIHAGRGWHEWALPCTESLDGAAELAGMASAPPATRRRLAGASGADPARRCARPAVNCRAPGPHPPNRHTQP